MLRVMSFNLRTAAANDGENNWDKRRELAFERIRAFQPDLAGLQEVHSLKMAPDLCAALPEYDLLGVERGGPGDPAHEISAVLVRKGIFDILSQRHFWLSETPDVPGSRSWGSAFPRTVEFVRLNKREGGPELLFANTHLDYIPGAARAGARCLRRELETLPADLPLVLTGDFNAGRRSAAYRALTGPGSERELVDALRARLGGRLPGGLGSFHGFGALPTFQDIDWVLVSSHFHVADAGIDRTARPPLYPSDHCPLWVILDL